MHIEYIIIPCVVLPHWTWGPRRWAS